MTTIVDSTNQELKWTMRLYNTYNVNVPGVTSFPGLHAQLLSLAVRKAGEGLDGFIT